MTTGRWRMRRSVMRSSRASIVSSGWANTTLVLMQALIGLVSALAPSLAMARTMSRSEEDSDHRFLAVDHHHGPDTSCMKQGGRRADGLLWGGREHEITLVLSGSEKPAPRFSLMVLREQGSRKETVQSISFGRSWLNAGPACERTDQQHADDEAHEVRLPGHRAAPHGQQAARHGHHQIDDQPAQTQRDDAGDPGPVRRVPS